MGMNGAAASVQRTFHIVEKMSLETAFNAYNLFQPSGYGFSGYNPTDPSYGRVTGEGVSGVKVLYEKKQLVVAYDDAKTTPTAITKATAAVGFPSKNID